MELDLGLAALVYPGRGTSHRASSWDRRGGNVDAISVAPGAVAEIADLPGPGCIRVTIEHGHANCHSNDYSSTAYWYRDKPHGAFPPLPTVTDRLPLPDEESLERFRRTLRGGR